MTSMNFYYQNNSKNYGLERLSYNLHRSQQDGEKQISKPIKEQMPVMLILERISSFSRSDFQYKWSIIVFICNLYNFFTVPYFIGLQDFPQGSWLGIELVFEFILILDFIGRVLAKDYMESKNLWLLNEGESLTKQFFLLISSIPYTFIAVIAGGDLTTIPIALSRLGKLFRYFQFSTFFSNLEIIKIEATYYTIQLIKLIMLLLASVHYLSSIWNFIARIERSTGYQNWTENLVDNGASNWEMYVDSCFWAAESLTGIIIENSVDYSLTEKVLCVLVMMLGAFIYAAIFGRLAAILERVNSQQEENRAKLEMASIWGEQRKLSTELKRRLSIYYGVARDKFANQVNYKFIDELPLSLKTEVSLFMFKDMVAKVKLFELGDPSFMMALVRYLRPRLYMSGDFIIRQGDYANEFYILRTGLVEVIASDGHTQIALMTEGSYFGEIGVLFGVYRTVSIRACEACIICYMSKEAFLQVIKSFPEHLHFLTQVARQRQQCINVEDFDTTYDLLEDSSGSDDSDNSDDLEPPKFYTEREHFKKFWFTKFLTVPESNAPRDRVVIDPLGDFYYIWTGILLGSFIYYLFYVPFSICFQDDGHIVLVVLNFFTYVVYIVDVNVHLYTSIITEFGTYSHSKEEVKREYFKNYFLYDILSIVPSDFICYFLKSQQFVPAYLRLFRLFKYSRVKQLLKVLVKNSGAHFSAIRLAFIMSSFIYFSHLYGCLFFYVAKIEYYYGQDRFDHANFIKVYDLQSIDDEDLLDQSLGKQYITMLYAGASVISIAAYGDIDPIASSEKIFALVWILISRLLAAFLYAEVATLIGSLNRTYIRHLNKVKLVKQWSNHIQLPKKLKMRILNYYNLIWDKLQGCNDDEVLKDLPESLRTDISYFLFKGLASSGLFPETDTGALLSLVRKCKVECYCAQETIISEGELGLEMYFIMEGQVKVITSLNVVLNRLKKGSFFGEIALVKPTPDVRLASVIAETDVTLAVLSLVDYKEIASMFPDFAEKVTHKAAEREIMNRATFSVENLEAMKEYQKLVEQFEDPNLSDQNRYSNETFDITTQVIIPVKRGKILNWLIKHRADRYIYAIVWCWNMLFIPYKIAFRTKFSGFGFFFEALTILLYMSHCFYYLSLVFSPNLLILAKRDKNILISLVYLLIGFPFMLIGDYTNFTPLAFAFFGIFRLMNFHLIFTVFSKLKVNIHWFITISVIEIFIIYLLLNHFVGCYYIFIGKEYNISNSWMNLANYGDSDFSVYVYSFYWANATLSHSSVGDIYSVNHAEKLFNCFIFLICCYCYGVLFGYISSLVSGFASQLKTNLQDSYIYVMNFVRKKKVDKIFSGIAEDYYNHIWHSSKGIMENSILDELPHSIKISIQMYTYSNSIIASHIFKDSSGAIDYNITQSLFRLMTIQYFLVGDSIIKVGDKNFDMYIILEGEVDVLNIQGKKVLATLKEGAHFGEANIILKNEMRTATIMATKISKIGILTKDNLEILFDAYPNWYELLEGIVKSRMKQTFNANSNEDVSKQVKDISEKIKTAPGSYKKYTKRSEKLMAPKLAELLIQTSSGKWLTLNFVHLILIIYSSFAIPFTIFFRVQLNPAILFMECLVLTESFVYLVLNTKENWVKASRQNLDWDKGMIYLYKNYFLIDLSSVSPFNLLFGLVGNYDNWYVIILCVVRLISILRLNSLLEKLEMQNRNMVNYLNLFRILFGIVLIMHWCSCLWFYIANENKDYGWVNYFHLGQENNGVLYENSLYYVMNIISGTGYKNTKPIADKERVYSIFLTIIGFVLFSGSFGLMASISHSNVTQLQEMMKNIRSPFSYINKTEVPQSIVNRLEQYYAFTTGLTQTLGPIDFKSLYQHLPPNIVGTIIYECNKSMLKKLPFLAQSESTEMIERISLCLYPQIYLPEDYVIYKNDIGEEMFFIIMGSVDILGPDNYKVVKTLRKGEFFGEVALLTDSRRMCSVVSNGLSLIYSLSKSDFLGLIVDFPDLETIIEQEIIKRKLENTSIKSEEIAEHRSDMQEDLVQTLSMFSSIAPPYFNRNNSPKKLSLLAGMKRYDSEVIKESYNTKVNNIFHKRRPGINDLNQPRLSQRSLGREVVISRFSKFKPT